MAEVGSGYGPPLTSDCFLHMLENNPLNVVGRAPTLDDPPNENAAPVKDGVSKWSGP
ncbi:protein of unknown function [Methylorubrum extorquens]|uniref:Uncharacterized protein n=1 Tax=Methylorubrum extorquens TaxID=408 RepID=A0A2N9AQX4_METEX|nr:protein of unknown function [Methylorubrum extorquens]